MPKHVGVSYRWDQHLPKSELSRYRVGNVVEQYTFFCTCADEAAACDGNVRTTVFGQTGAKIECISQDQIPNEALFTAGTKFKVLDRVDLSDGNVELILKEVA